MCSSGGARYRSSAFSSKSKKFEEAVISAMDSSGSSDWFDDPVERWRVLMCPLGVPLGTGLLPLLNPRAERDLLLMIDTVALLFVGNLNFVAPGPSSQTSVSDEVDFGVSGE